MGRKQWETATKHRHDGRIGRIPGSFMSRLATFLSGAAASAGIIAAVTLLTGAKAPPTKFEEIDVGRINVREPDGTLRMVISNRTQFPGAPWRGGETPRPDRRTMAGMLFVNDEGTENGGLIQKGSLDANGKANAGLSLTFDRFRQDQVVQLLHAEKDGYASTWLAMNDETDGTKFDVSDRAKRFKEIEAMPAEEAKVARAQMGEAGQLATNRLRLGVTPGRSSTLMLSDAKGRTRLMLLVTPEGEASIQFKDESGKVVKTVALDEVAAK